MIKEDLTETVTFKMDPEGGGGVSHEAIWGKFISGRGKCQCEGPAVAEAWVVKEGQSYRLAGVG